MMKEFFKLTKNLTKIQVKHKSKCIKYKLNSKLNTII